MFNNLATAPTAFDIALSNLFAPSAAPQQSLCVFNATANYFGSTSDAVVRTRLRDFYLNGQSCIIEYFPYLASADTTGTNLVPESTLRQSFQSGSLLHYDTYSDVTLTIANSPYTATAFLVVHTGATLTVEVLKKN